MRRNRLLGVLLCYNDADILADAVTHLLDTNHDVIAWDHGSTDDTPDVLRTFTRDLLEHTRIPRDTDFYDLYPLMSEHLQSRYVESYDWISWPDQDEILEGPDRTRSFDEHLADAIDSPYDWIVFNDLTFWHTDKDDPSVESPIERIRHYSLAAHAMPRIRSWRASATNVRWFNHNPLPGTAVPTRFNLRHYPMRSEAQMRRRLVTDRAHIRRGSLNYHYENLAAALEDTTITADQLHYDDGVTPLTLAPKFDWSSMYGGCPRSSTEESQQALAAMTRHMAFVLRDALARPRRDWGLAHGMSRLARWRKVSQPHVLPLVLLVGRQHAAIVDGMAIAGTLVDAGEMTTTERTVAVPQYGASFTIQVQSTHVVTIAIDRTNGFARSPLLLLLSMNDRHAHQMRVLDRPAMFDNLHPGRYWIAIEPLCSGQEPDE